MRISRKPTALAITKKRERLEKFYADKKYRDEILAPTDYGSFAYCRKESVLKADELMKQKLNLPENSFIRYETPKISYYTAYIYNPITRKMDRKYLGKHLPM